MSNSQFSLMFVMALLSAISAFGEAYSLTIYFALMLQVGCVDLILIELKRK